MQPLEVGLLSLLSLALSLLDKVFGYVSGTEQAKYTAEGQVGVASVEAMGAVETKWSFVAMMIPVLSLPVGVYLWKAMAWDKVIGPWLGYHSSTDALGGDLSKAFWIILTGIFLHAMVE